MFVSNTVSQCSSIGTRLDNDRFVFVVKHSKCRSDFLNRVKLNEKLKRAAKEAGKPVPLASIKRQVR
jgi:hypothetical protein